MAARRKSSPKKKSTRRFPKGVQVQTLIFDANQFSAQEARSWASEHGFKAPATDDARYGEWAHEEFIVSGHRAPSVGLFQYRRMGGRVFG